jgi:hypothetical protein
LAPFSLALTSFDTTLILTTLHPKLDGYFPLILKNYELNHDFKLSFDSFKLAFQRMLHLSTSDPFGMIFEHFQDCFHPKIQQVDSLSCSNNDGANGNMIVCLLNERYLDIPIFLSTSTSWYDQEISPYIVFFCGMLMD